MARGAVPAARAAGHGRQRHRRPAPSSIQQEIREAALEAILAWRAGRPWPCPSPSHELLVEMLSVRHGRAGARRVRRHDRRRSSASTTFARRAREPLRRAGGLPGADHRRRRVGHLRGRQPAEAGRPVHDRREERDGGRHLVGEPLPGRRRRHAEPPLLVLVRRPTTGRCTSRCATSCTTTSSTSPTEFDAPRRTSASTTEVERADYDEDAPDLGGRPSATPTAAGRRCDANVVISAVGHLQPAGRCPNIKGLDTFAGPVVPHRPLARRTSTSPASGWRSSATAPARCRSGRRSRTRSSR